MNSNFIAWLLLGASVVSEVAGTIALKHSNGFTRLFPAVLAASCYVLAVWLMSIAMKQLEMGLTYAVWAASGIAVTAIVGIVVYGEPATTFTLAGLGLVVGGVVLLALSAKYA